ncbi:hypothetical protein C1646_773811 [Rhizophagus diaphanus]|nr:hypothetical protein C1646_773811 [Rhizophagus diaphanus] [Rhizophagus sp. MUCL 43196]
MSSELELLRQRITELEAENMKLRQIIEENSKHEAENAEHKVRIEELEKNSADISAENAELKAELAKLRHDFNSSNLTRPQQFQHVTNVQNSCSVGEEDISSVTAVPQPDVEPERHLASNDIPDPVIDQYVSIAKQHVVDNSDIKSMKERETDAFLAIQDLSSVTKDKESQSHKKRKAENIVQDVANSLSELSDSQFQTIIDYFSKNPNTELPNGQESYIIDSEEEISDDQTNASITSEEIDSTSQSVKETNEEVASQSVKTDDDSDCNRDSDSEEEMPGDSNDDEYDGYGERDRGYYYCNKKYERKVSPMMSPIISLVTA